MDRNYNACRWIIPHKHIILNSLIFCIWSFKRLNTLVWIVIQFAYLKPIKKAYLAYVGRTWKVGGCTNEVYTHYKCRFCACN